MYKCFRKQAVFLSVSAAREAHSEPSPEEAFHGTLWKERREGTGGLELGKPERGRGFPALIQGEEMRASLVLFSSGDQWAPFFSPLCPHSPPGLRSRSLTQGLTCSLGRGSLLALVLLGLAASSWPRCAGKAGASTPQIGCQTGRLREAEEGTRWGNQQ